MTFLDMFRQMGVFALMTMVMAVVPLIMAVGYVVAPTERNLALMRPISLAAIFSTLAGVSSGGMAVLRSVAAGPRPGPACLARHGRRRCRIARHRLRRLRLPDGSLAARDAGDAPQRLSDAGTEKRLAGREVQPAPGSL